MSLESVTTALGDPARGTRSRLPLKYESSVALTNWAPWIVPRLLTVLGWLMSVRSRTTYELLPRRVTSARSGHRVEDGEQGLENGVGLSVGELRADGEADGDGAVPTVGVVLHAEAVSAARARARNHTAVLISCSGNGPAID
jgi:hypothetical protein